MFTSVFMPQNSVHRRNLTRPRHKSYRAALVSPILLHFYLYSAASLVHPSSTYVSLNKGFRFC
jgi:hypothetical protein